MVSSKVTALFVGPSGMALIGNMRNFATSLETISTFGLQNGIIKNVAGTDAETGRFRAVVATVCITSGLAIFITASGLFFFAGYWNQLVFGDHGDFVFLFRMTGVLLPLYAMSFVLLALLNGLRQYRKVIFVTMAGNLIGLLLTVLLLWQYRTVGALVAIVLTPSLLCAFTLFFVQREINLFGLVRISAFDAGVFRSLLSFSAMAFFSAVAGPFVFLAIRNYAIAHTGIATAGYWTTMDLISNYYFLFISTLLTVYFFPKLSAAKSQAETGAVLKEYFTRVVPVFALALLVLFALREWVIRLLFTADFLPVSGLFGWQILGDVLKASALILGYNLLARQRTAMFIVTECISMGIMFFLGRYWISLYGIQGIVMAHVATYAVYLMILLAYFRKSLSARE